MQQITCPHCGAGYDPAVVAQYSQFTCGACHQVVHLAPPVAEPLQEAEAPARPRGAARRGRPAAAAASGRRTRRGVSEDTGEDDEGPTPGGIPRPALIAGGCVVIGAAVVAFALTRGGSEPQDVVATGTDAVEEPGQRSLREEWAELSSTEREARAAALESGADLAQPEEFRRTHALLVSVGEEARARRLAERYVEKFPAEDWAHEALGHVNLSVRVDDCLRRCRKADEMESPAAVELKQLKESSAPPKGGWWADAATVERVDGLIAQVEKEDAQLASPYSQGVARWVQYVRRMPVAGNYHFVQQAVGPSIVFVGIEADPGVLRADVPAEKEEAARASLQAHAELMKAFYEGWMENMGPVLGLTRYGEDNVDDEAFQKVYVFPNKASFEKYHEVIEQKRAGGFPAHYQAVGTHFLNTYQGARDGDTPEGETDWKATRTLVAHEAVHQIVHFYTWDLTRKARGEAPSWEACDHRRLWSKEGFAEFFSGHMEAGGGWIWMQPIDRRMAEIAAYQELVTERGWQPWRLKEILVPRTFDEVATQASYRGKPEEAAAAQGAFLGLFYARAWSLHYFMWNAMENGRPKWRDAFIRTMKNEFVVQYEKDPRDGIERPQRMSSKDFQRSMGIIDSGAFDRFEAEWNAFEKDLLAKHRNADWEKVRKKVFEAAKPK